jgi:hypothetical protein
MQKLLQKLSDWRPADAGRHSWQHQLADEGWTVALTVDRVDTLGILLWDITLRRITPTTVTANDFQARIAPGIARATGLLEPLTVHEVDTTQMVALARSTADAMHGEQKRYYEVRFDGLNTIAVRRYQVSATGKREQVAFALTQEALAKLVGDLTAAG